MVLDSKDELYDVIVIGSGLGGMTAANKLAKNSRKVLLLEAHHKLGGLATWFNRKGTGKHIFDVSLHGFPVGMIKTIKKYWSREIANSIVQLKDIRYINPQFEVTTDFTQENFTNILTSEFGISQDRIDKFFDELKNMNFYDAPTMTNRQLFEKHFPNRSDVVRFLLEPITYANGSTLEDEAITYGIVFSNFMNKGVFTFEGGTDLLITKMKNELTQNGVTIKCRSKVDRIIIKDGKAQGVEVKGKTYWSKSVLSNAGLTPTIKDLVGEDHFQTSFRTKAQKVRTNTSSCQVYIGIKQGETIPFVGDLIFYSQAKEFNTDLMLSPDVTSQTFSLYYPKTRPQIEQRYSIVSSSNARYVDWSNLSKDEYEKRKNDLIENALNAIETIIPNIRSMVDYLEAATPLTIERYTGHHLGTSFGTKFEGLDVSMNMHKEIPGLFHTGSVGIIMSGWLGAANYGVIQSHEIENYLHATSFHGTGL